MPGPRIFISYSRKDGIAFAAGLRKRLEAEDLSVWQDIVAMEGGRDWWSQIDEVIRSKELEHFVLVVTPQALDSEGGKVIRQEIRLARQEGKTVSPIRGPGIDDLAKLPRWFGHVYDIGIRDPGAKRFRWLSRFRGNGIREQFTKLIRVLQGPSTQKRLPMLAPKPPPDFVARPAEFDALKQRLLDAKGDAVAVTAVLKGAGGYGKTTLAKALAHDADVQNAYFNGILWVELGEKPDNLLGKIADLVTALTGTPPGLQTVDAAAAALGDALGDLRILLIIDDAWRQQDLRPFIQRGLKTTLLITTRNDKILEILPDNTLRQTVDAMQSDEALALLTAGLSPSQVPAQRSELAALAGRLGEWALLLKLVNGFLRNRVVDAGEPLQDAIEDANARLDEEGLTTFDASDEDDRTKAVASTINLSRGRLDDKQRVRFAELAVFPEDADIPVGIVARLWWETAGLIERQTKDVLTKFFGLSLLLDLNLDRRTFRFHDTTRRFLQDQAGKEGLVVQHKLLLHALDDIATSCEADALSRLYFYLYRPHHLAEAGERGRLDALLLDPGWLKAKLAATGKPLALVADYDQHGVGELQKYVGRTLRLTTGICACDQSQLIPQLLGRIMGCKATGTAEFFEAARRQVVPPVILEQGLSLTPPGAETARLGGHTNSVTALCMLPDGRLASGSDDHTIRLWDLTGGTEPPCLDGHTKAVTALCVLPDGRFASGSDDHTIRLWDLTSGAKPPCLEGHTKAVTALCVLPDGRLASGSNDKTIRLWNLTSCAETACIKGHSSWVTALCALPDGRLASGSYDKTIRLWDLTSGAEIACLEGHSSWVTALCALPDGRLASSSKERTIRVWDLNSGAEIACLEGHSAWITALCRLPDGRLASGSDDHTIRLWDLTNRVETACLKGHSNGVTTLCVLPDGRLASGSRTIRLWDLTSRAETARVEGHSKAVTALCVLPDGRLASGANDKTIRLWDLTSRAETACLKGHSSWVTALCALPDGRLASGSYDKTIRLWDLTSGAEIACLEGHSTWVSALCALPDGRLTSSSKESTIRLWDLTSGAETACLEGHSSWVTALCTLPDGRLASGSDDHTIRLWDLTSGAKTFRLKGHSNWITALGALKYRRLASRSKTIRPWHLTGGTETACLKGHSNEVTALCMLPDRHLLASGSDDRTIRLWDLTTGAETACLKGHSSWVTALCMLPGGHLLASGSDDRTIRLWDLITGAETARLDVDAAVNCMTLLPNHRLVAGDQLGRLHWLEVVV